MEDVEVDNALVTNLAFKELGIKKFTNTNISIKLERGEIFHDLTPYVYFLKDSKNVRKFIYKPKVIYNYKRMVKTAINENALSKNYNILTNLEVILEYIAALNSNSLLPDVINETENFIELAYYFGDSVDYKIIYDKKFQLQLHEYIVYSMSRKVRVDIDFYGVDNIIFDVKNNQYKAVDLSGVFPVRTYWCELMEMGAIKYNWCKGKQVLLYFDSLNIHKVPFEKVKEKIIYRYGKEYQIIKNMSKNQITMLDKITKGTVI